MDEKKKIERKEQNDLDGMNYFLTEVIDRSLLNKVKDKYKGFLLTMEQHDDSLLRTIAERLGKRSTLHSNRCIIYTCVGGSRSVL